MMNEFRKINYDLVKYYELNVSDVYNITSKAFKIKCNNGNSFFVKRTIPNALEKYHFLYNQSCNNVLYPVLNKENKYVTRKDSDAIYINDFYETFNIKNEVRLNNYIKEINNIHNWTSFKKQLNPSTSRAKFDEMSNRLDYQFRLIEDYVRGVEASNLDENTMSVLGNYHYILDAKKELIRLQKRIISVVKAKEGVDYSFIHNNPKLDNLLNIKGAYYLTSIENGKIGIYSLDLAKLYVENEDINIDFKNIYSSILKNENNQFYYDYFRYLVLLIYIRRINLTNNPYLNGVIFNNTALKIKKYFENFSDYQEEVS